MAKLTVQQALDLARQHRQAGRLDEAERIYRSILSVQPPHPGALNRRAMTQANNDLGCMLASVGRFDEAITAFGQSIALNPRYGEVHSNLGNALREKGRLDEAAAAYRNAIAIRPDYAPAHCGLGYVLKSAGHIDQAISCYRQAIALDPDFPEALNNLGNALGDIGQVDEAIGVYRRAISLKPNFAAAHSNLILSLHYHPGFDSRMIGDEVRQWGRQHADGVPRLEGFLPNTLIEDRRLRIGYVSADLREHVVGRHLLPVLRHHDRQRFEITCYAHVCTADAMTGQIEQHSDRWRNIAAMTDDQAARLIRADQIDILVDLSLHTAQNRLLIFPRKPAPVQVTWLGYCGSSGMAAMDFRLSDPYLDPPEADLSCYTEQTLRLPRTYWCFEPRPSPPVAPPPVLNNGFVTFGCLNNFAKVSLAALDLWARILAGMPRSRIIIHSAQGAHRDALLHRMANAGISPDRVRFVTKEPWESFVQRYAQIDIALDPFPYGGGITTLDALWMGVPTITLSGQTAVGRGGRSILSNIELPELVASSPAQYQKIALELASDTERMRGLRLGMRERMAASPLADLPQFTREIEAAYRELWKRFCAKGPASR
jgi:predicted O-linked N-acetylglucosamine transferase (SPINDLY family)